MTGNSFGTDPMALSTRRAQSFYGDDHSRYAVDWAYGFNKNGRCSFVSDGNLPQRWAGLDAVGTIHRSGADGGRFPRTTRQQSFLNGKAPKQETMIRNMLGDRLKIALHREMKEGPVCELVMGKSGPKLTPEKETESYGMDCAPHRRLVVDRTGISGEFNFDIDFAPFDNSATTTTAATIFTAIQEQTPTDAGIRAGFS